MEIIKTYPPNIETIRKAIPGAPLHLAVFAWGDKIYNPGGKPVGPDVVAHEEQHGRQHEAFEGGPEAWWVKYLADSTFRLEQEVEAYHAQYIFVKERSSRQVARDFLKRIARDLSGPMYGNLCSFETAKTLIYG